MDQKGFRIGDYYSAGGPQNLLGRGAFADVYKGVHNKTGMIELIRKWKPTE
jgi:hypothetical protein